MDSTTEWKQQTTSVSLGMVIRWKFLRHPFYVVARRQAHSHTIFRQQQQHKQHSNRVTLYHKLHNMVNSALFWVEDHLFATKDINCSGKRLIIMVRTVDPKSLKNNMLDEICSQPVNHSPTKQRNKELPFAFLRAFYTQSPYLFGLLKTLLQF